MKNSNGKQKIIINILIIIILILMMELLEIKTGNIKNNKQIIKEMTEVEYESKLTELNTSHKDYALQVQENKRKLAAAITEQKVTTSEDATIDEIVANIGKILEEGTKDANATADNITAGKTAYVNGKLITGTGVDNENYYNQGKGEISEKLIFEFNSMLVHTNSVTSSKWLNVDVSKYNNVRITYSTNYSVNLYVYSSSDGNIIKVIEPNDTVTLTVTEYENLYFSQSDSAAWFGIKIESIN